MSEHKLQMKKWNGEASPENTKIAAIALFDDSGQQVSYQPLDSPQHVRNGDTITLNCNFDQSQTARAGSRT